MVLPMLLTVLLVAVWAEGQDYYELLGVSREATTKEIRRAFKQLALTMHPDKNPVSYADKPQSRNTKKWHSNSPKSVASRWNPDKTDAYWLFQGDPAAHEKFLQVNRAYEVLKDEDLRKKYDKYGEKGLDEQQGGRYESWNYYRYDFGK